MVAEIELSVACIQIEVLGLHLPHAYKIIYVFGYCCISWFILLQ